MCGDDLSLREEEANLPAHHRVDFFEIAPDDLGGVLKPAEQPFQEPDSPLNAFADEFTHMPENRPIDLNRPLPAWVRGLW